MIWILIAYALSMLVWVVREFRNFVFGRKNKTVICPHEGCGFAVLAPIEKSELCYETMNDHQANVHNSGPWANYAVSPSSN